MLYQSKFDVCFTYMLNIVTLTAAVSLLVRAFACGSSCDRTRAAKDQVVATPLLNAQ